MSSNHNQSLDRALEIVDEAAKAGADEIKLQSYTRDTMTIDVTGGLFSIDDKDSLWYGKNLYDLYELALTQWDWHQSIFERAKNAGLLLHSTPVADTSDDFLDELGRA